MVHPWNKQSSHPAAATKEKLQDSLKALKHSVETVEKREFLEEINAPIYRSWKIDNWFARSGGD